MATALTTELGAKTLRRLKVPDPLTPGQVSMVQKQLAWVEGALKALQHPKAHGMSLEQWRELAQRVADVTALLAFLKSEPVVTAGRRAAAVLRGGRFPRK